MEQTIYDGREVDVTAEEDFSDMANPKVRVVFTFDVKTLAAKGLGLIGGLLSRFPGHIGAQLGSAVATYKAASAEKVPGLDR